MQSKLDWLSQRKQQLLKQMQDADSQQQQSITALLQELGEKSKQIQTLNATIKQQNQKNQEELLKNSAQIHSLEAVVVSKQEFIETLQQQNAYLTANQDKNQATIQSQTLQILQLQHSLSLSDEEIHKRTQEWMAQKDKIEIFSARQLAAAKEQHLQLLAQKEQEFSTTQQREMAALRLENMKLVEKVQSDYQQLAARTQQAGKKSEGETGRLITEQAKLMSSLNEYRLRVVELQASLNAAQQQAKLLQKELEMQREGSRRENQFLKQQRNELLDKIRKLNQKTQQLSWNNRQMELKRQEDVNRLRKEIDKSLKEVLLQSQEETANAQLIIKQLQTKLLKQQEQYEDKTRLLLKQIKDQQTELKEIQEQLEKAKAKKEDSAPRKENKQNNFSQGRQEMLKDQLIKKNCEIEVLEKEIIRLKTKVNTVANAHEELLKQRQLMQKENQMLLSEIVFLRGKDGKGKQKDRSLSGSGILSGMQSDRSQEEEDVEEYKKLIKYMTDEMGQVSRKVQEKDILIEKQRAIIDRLQKMLDA